VPTKSRKPAEKFSGRLPCANPCHITLFSSLSTEKVNGLLFRESFILGRRFNSLVVQRVVHDHEKGDFFPHRSIGTGLIPNIAEFFNVLMPEGAKFEVWPGYESIFIRRPKEADVGDDSVPDRESQLGAFGLVPHWTRVTDVDAALVSQSAYNSRSETTDTKRTFWTRGSKVSTATSR
jgi:hypothetical protein